MTGNFILLINQLKISMSLNYCFEASMTFMNEIKYSGALHLISISQIYFLQIFCGSAAKS
jgi:hypothetical protein